MKPITKAHSISFAISTAVVYGIWNWLASIQTNFFIISLIIAFAMSLTFYKGIFHLLLFLCEHIPILKKMILGKYYLEGIWIGFNLVDNEIEYYYEIFEQSLDETIIKGVAYGADRKKIGEWTIVNPTLNIAESKLTYYYEMNDISVNDIPVGHSRATLYWDNKHSYAYRLVGFAIDNFSKEKQNYISMKVKTTDNLQTWVDNNFWVEVEKLYNDEVK